MWSTFFESLKLTKIFSKISVNFEGEKNSRPQFGNPETSSFSVLNFYIPDAKKPSFNSHVYWDTM